MVGWQWERGLRAVVMDLWYLYIPVIHRPSIVSLLKHIFLLSAEGSCSSCITVLSQSSMYFRNSNHYILSIIMYYIYILYGSSLHIESIDSDNYKITGVSYITRSNLESRVIRWLVGFEIRIFFSYHSERLRTFRQTIKVANEDLGLFSCISKVSQCVGYRWIQDLMVCVYMYM